MYQSEEERRSVAGSNSVLPLYLKKGQTCLYYQSSGQILNGSRLEKKSCLMKCRHPHDIDSCIASNMARGCCKKKERLGSSSVSDISQVGSWVLKTLIRYGIRASGIRGSFAVSVFLFCSCKWWLFENKTMHNFWLNERNSSWCDD